MDIESGFSLRLSRLLQIGINGNYLLLRLPLRVERFPDYFKSELMETFIAAPALEGVTPW